MLHPENAHLVTPRLSLEPLVAAHADALFEVLADPATRRWIPPSKARTVDDLRERWRALETRCSPDGAEARLGWAVRRIDDGAYIGKLDANVDAAGVATNVGYLFAPAVWGRGYATEAVGALVRHLLDAGVTQLRALVTAGNEPSCRVLERLGFERAGVLVGNEVLAGVAHDDVLFVLTAG
ncbi:MAG: GNAT family N-acetyltransferase [Pseudomonadota bacterium]|nr:GNAT family N-acetyltransferase [Pseudomonadota bacterium]